MSSTVLVTYPTAEGARFDRPYWLHDHFALVRRTWVPLGLEDVAGFFPEGGGGGILAFAAVRFRDEQAAREAFTPEKGAAVMDDVQRFTDIPPQRFLLAPFPPS